MKKGLKNISGLVLLFVAFFMVNNVSAASSSIGPIYNGSGSPAWNGVSYFPYKYDNSSGKAVFCTTFLINGTTYSGNCSVSDWNKAVKAGVGQIIHDANVSNGNMTKNYYYAELAINLFLYNYNGGNWYNWPYGGTSLNYLLTDTSGTSYQYLYDNAVDAYNKAKSTKNASVSLKKTSGLYINNVDTGDNTSITNKYSVTSENAKKFTYKLVSDNAPSGVTFKINDTAVTLGQEKTATSLSELKVQINGLSAGQDFSVRLEVHADPKDAAGCYFATNYSCTSGVQDFTPNSTDEGDCYTTKGADAHKTIIITTYDEPEFPKVSVIKKDTSGNNISNAIFELRNKTSNSLLEVGDLTAFGLIPIDEEGTYCVKELASAPGYVITDTSEHCFKVALDSSNKVIVSDLGSGLTYNSTANVVTLTMTNAKNKVKLGKVDKDGNLIAGAKMNFKGPGNVNHTWTSTTSYEVLEGLMPGTYTLTEVEAAPGYKKTLRYKNVKISLTSDTSAVITETIPNEEITLVISKKAISGTGELEGAELKVCKQSESNDSTCTPIKTIHNVELKWISGTTERVFSGVPAGDYKLVETTAPNGYVKTESINFSIDEYGILTRGGSSTGSIVMYNSQNEINVKKVDNETNQVVVGAVLKITDSTGKTVKLDGKELEWTTEATAKKISGLKIGTYYIEEVSAPDGYVLSNEKVVFSVDDKGVVKQNGIIKTDLTLLVNNKKNELKVSKVDEKGNLIENAVLKITDSNGETVKLNGKNLEWTTDGKEKVIKGLPKGTYYLEEVEAPEGYAKSNEKIEFSVDSKGYIVQKDVVKDSLTIIMTNALTKVHISKQDITTKEELPGAKLQLFDGRNVLVKEWISGNEPYYIEGLATNQTYTLVEITAPDGYDKAESITFTINEDGSITGDTVMYDKLSTVKVEDTLLNRSILVIVFGAILVISGIVISRKNEIKKMTK